MRNNFIVIILYLPFINLCNYFASVCFERRYRWTSFDPEEDWFNPGFLESVVNNTDLEIKEVFFTLRRDVTTFETLIRLFKK